MLAKDEREAVTADLIEFIQAHRRDAFGSPRYLRPFGERTKFTNWGVSYVDEFGKTKLLYLVYDDSTEKWGLSVVMNLIIAPRKDAHDAITTFKLAIGSIPLIRKYQRMKRDNLANIELPLPGDVLGLMLR